MCIQWIVSDLDGTLLDTEQEALSIPPALKTAIDRWLEAGGQFAVATGRPALTAQPILDRMGLKIPRILANGALVLSSEGDILARDLIDPDVLLPVLKKAAEHITVLLFTDDAVFASRRDAWTDRYQKKENAKIRPWSQYAGDPLCKALLIGEQNLLQRFWEKQDDSVQTRFHTMVSEPHYLEILGRTTSKGKGLQILMEASRIAPSCVAAIGNQMNDASLLAAAGRGFAVSDAAEELKQKADATTQGACTDGVIEILTHYTKQLQQHAPSS